ncbi:MAG: DUF655 domain-containing protein [Thermoplasmata archaeon]|nr:DUF655 domain-containing protein [Thermoplasmata archaeon]
MEEYAYILDYLPQGHMDDKRFHREPVAYALGDKEFKLLELIPKEGAALLTGDRVYIGKDSGRRERIHQVRRRVSYADLTHAAQSELPFIILEIVNAQEERFVKFFNDAQPVTTRFHMLELLPGLGKKSMWSILEARKKGKFTSFKDIEERAGVHHPEKLIAKRIELEIADPHQKYRIFVVK